MLAARSPRAKPLYSRTDLLNDAGGFIAEQRWQLRRLDIPAFPKHNLGPIKADGLNFEANLVRIAARGRACRRIEELRGRRFCESESALAYLMSL